MIYEKTDTLMDTLMDIRKARENFNKDRKPQYFNCNTYRYMVKEC